MTQEQIEAHEEAGYEYHIPAIVHRTGGPSADESNVCGICGVRLKRSDMYHDDADLLWIEDDG